MELALRFLRPVLRAAERLVDALADPARRERTVLIVLAAYAAIWTLYGVLSKAIQDVQSDTAELVAWSHHLEIGYAKHPPLAAWLMHAWFTLFPIRDWSCYLLAMVYAALGLWIAWRLFERFLDPDKRIVALACLTMVPYFNFLGLRFDHNAVLGALWAATTLCFIRAFETRSAAWSAAAGATAAAAMLGKYWSIFLLAGLAVAALADTRRASYFRSAAPWITVGVGALLLAPHVAWLVAHNFIPLSYAVDSHSAKTSSQLVIAAAGYLAGGIGYAAVPVLLVLALTRPSGAALADMLIPRTPERRFAAVAFWTTFLLPAVVAIVLDFGLNPIWTMSGFVLLPVVLLSSPAIVVSRRAVVPIVAFAVALPPVMLAAAPAIALAIHVAGVDPPSAHAKLLAGQIEQQWRLTTDRPLRIVGGDFGIANMTAFYLPDLASAFPVLEPETAPWVTPERIAREGAVMMCELPDDINDCAPLINQAIDRVTAHNPPRRRVEVTTTRSYLGIPGRPARFLLIVVPPRP
jgi:4-amino-4-deoxy-L-arabinose transferase-like glycosyltransferase